MQRAGQRLPPSPFAARGDGERATGGWDRKKSHTWFLVSLRRRHHSPLPASLADGGGAVARSETGTSQILIHHRLHKATLALSLWHARTSFVHTRRHFFSFFKLFAARHRVRRNRQMKSMFPSFLSRLPGRQGVTRRSRDSYLRTRVLCAGATFAAPLSRTPRTLLLVCCCFVGCTACTCRHLSRSCAFTPSRYSGAGGTAPRYRGW